MEIKKEIKKRLEEKLDLIHFEIKDFTGRHLNHKLHEGGFHSKPQLFLMILLIKP